ncbi:MAG: outer membrane protein assembly factor BamA [Candidatus Brocadiaceae bacterium]|jgi:outer membrane protein insertion porin family
MSQNSEITIRRRHRVGCLVLAACLWLLTPVGAAEAATVARIRVRNNRLLTREEILDSVGLREGMPFDHERVKETVADWNAARELGTMSFRVEPTEEGDVELILEVSERVKVTRVAFEGNERFSAKRLAELVGIEPGDSVSPLEIRAAAQQIEFAYQEEGFSVTSVEGLVTVPSAEERSLTFYVTEGPRTFVEEIVCHGNEHVDAEEIEDAMQSRERGWISWFWPGWFDKETFQDDLPRVQSFYRSRGFLDAEVSGYPTYSDDMERAALHVVIEEGSLYHVREVMFEGNTLFRDDELLRAIPLEAGEPYRPGDLDAALAQISELYADQGRVDVIERKGNLSGEPVFPEKGTDVTVRIRVEEGDPVYIRRIHIRGLTKTRENVVRRNLNIYPGQRAGRSRLEESERLLRNTGFFDETAPDPVEITLEPDEGTLRDAVVRVKEGPTGRLLLGAGIGSESGLLGEISLVEDNFDITNLPSSWRDLWRGNAFRGGGQRLGLILRAGTERSYYSISYLNPAVRDSDYSFGVDIYSTGVAREEFDDNRTGFSVTGGQRLSKFVRRSVSLGYESIDVDDVDATAAAEIRRDEGSHSKPFVRFNANLDRRDSRFSPSEGHYLGAELEAAASDVETVKLTLRGEKYWTVRDDNGRHKHVVGVRGQMGMVDSYGDRVPVFERFYAGGIRTLRGFEYEGVSPVDPATEDQIGGESMLVGSVEYSLPITARDNVRFLTFMDAGYVEEDVEDVLTGWDEMRLSVGVGLRFRVPLFGATTIEIDLAAPLVKESEDETQTLHFSLGAERRF